MYLVEKCSLAKESCYDSIKSGPKGLVFRQGFVTFVVG